MGFGDLLADAGLSALNTWLQSRSYIVGYAPTQADVAIYKAVSSAPDATKYPHVDRWYKHIASYVDAFETLPGDASLPASTYGPETAPATETPAKAPAAAKEDDDINLFGSDDEEEDAEQEALARKRLEEYRAKKAAKGPGPAAKSIVTLEVKPWDDETDLAEMEKNVRAIEKDGLVWGASQLIAVGYGIKKLQINLVVEDEKISIDELQQEIEADEEHVQSTDVAAMQKL
ncbi:translation elongation factor 1 beta [Kalaharituber pfeilii]|nr:translation elongation factor 1 beta [Kalaharituber pfeilii]